MSNTYKESNALLIERINKLEQQRDELLLALKHLRHNARASGAEMGLALDVADWTITKVEESE